MKKIRTVLFCFILLAGYLPQVSAQGKKVVVSGVIANESGVPVPGACIGFSSSNQYVVVHDSLWSLVDTTYTDSAGNFSREILVDEYALGIRYVASKNGFKTAGGYGNIVNDRVDLGTIRLESIGLKKVTVFGSVVDYHGHPMSQATILLSGGIIIDTVNIVNGPFDTVHTKGNGRFMTEIEVNNDITWIMYLAGKWGKKAIRGYERIITDDNRVDVGVITLHKGDFNYVKVRGTVMDSKTGKPVEDASVIATSNSLVVIDVDSTHTDDDGSFSMRIKVERTGVIKPTATYSIRKRGYYLSKGTVRITGDTINLGRIELVDDGTPVQFIQRVCSREPDRIEIFSLKGQLLYSGKRTGKTATLLKHLGKQPAIVLYKLDNVVIYTMKSAGL